MSAGLLLFWFVCAFGSVALAAAPARTPVIALAAVGLGCAAGAWWLSPQHLPALETMGLTIALAGAASLYSSRAAIPAAIVAGVSGAAWAASMRSSGAPMVPALLIAIAPALLAAYLTPTRPAFAPSALRDEALVLASGLGLMAAIAPGVLEGWRSAGVLNVQDDTAAPVLPVWTMALIGGVVGLGGIYTWWRRA